MFIVKIDSAHFGKSCVVVEKLQSKIVTRVFQENPEILNISLGFGDEIYHYENITEIEFQEIKQKLIDDWNLFNSKLLEDDYKSVLHNIYKSKVD